MRNCIVLGLCGLLITLTAGAFAAQEILIADFEGDDYGAWEVSGKAFGPGPARGTLPGQMALSGFEGRGLANSYFEGDGAVGRLRSPPFRIERRNINFLIGGGKYPGKTCMNLIVDGKEVRTATGPNRRSGGSERLDWQFWEVSDLIGKEARIEIVDARRGGWGHINVDHIYQSDEKAVSDMEKEFVFDKQYLVFPVKHEGASRSFTLAVGETFRYFDIELAGATPDYWTYIDVREFAGQAGILRGVLPRRTASAYLDLIVQADTIPGAEGLYKEELRAQFHFSSRRGWNNDPNGLVYYGGEYHLFYQHNPFGWKWGNMHWGHAVSSDLVRWKELPDALHPDALGTIYSGSAVVDSQNTAGFQTGTEKPIIALYTSAGDHAPEPVPYTQSIAYSLDRGRSWIKFEGNPVLGHIAGSNRDPKVLWHGPTGKWVMALYLDKNDFALYGSKDLKSWNKLCDVEMPNTGECPDFFELPVDGDAENTKWVFWGANGNYVLGTFDGTVFTKEEGCHCLYAGGNAYAAQTYSDVPEDDGRRIQIAWLRQSTPGMPFNQMMTVPVELTLRNTAKGVRMCAWPVREIESLRMEEQRWSDVRLEEGVNPLEGVKGELFDIRVAFKVGDAKRIEMKLRGLPLIYDVRKKQLRCKNVKARLVPEDGLVRLRILLDRAAIEIFAKDGLVYMPLGHLFDRSDLSLGLSVSGGSAEISDMAVSMLRSAWE